MGVSRLNLDELRESAKRAAATQWDSLGQLRADTDALDVRPLPPAGPEVRTLGVVAADAGLVSVELSPFSLEFLFVADSLQRTHVAEIFPLTTLAENLEEIFERAPVLQAFADRLCLDWKDLTALWAKQLEVERLFPQDVRLVADTLRELAEWAVCAELGVTEECNTAVSPSLLILHDGMLRSVLLRSDVIASRLPEYWRRLWHERGVVIAGIGKSSLLWQRLALTLDLEAQVKPDEGMYVLIPKALEEQLSGRVSGDRRLGFGRLVLLRSRFQPSGIYLPVDLPEWIVEEREAMEQTLCAIAHISRTTFPRPGYPAPLGTAHEAAHLTEFDAKVVRDRVVEALGQIVSEGEFEQLLRSWAFQPVKWEKVGRIGYS